MGKFIFQNSSYIVGYGIDTEINIQITSTLKELGIRFVSFSDIGDLEEAYNKICYYCGGIIYCLDQKEYDALHKILDSKTAALYIVSAANITMASEKHTLVSSLALDDIPIVQEGLLTSSVPTSLDSLSVQSANFITPSLFPQFTTEYAVKDSHIESYHYQIMCDIAEEQFKGRAILRVDLDALRSASPDFKETTETLLLDSCRELVNQYLGIVNTNLMTQGYQPSVGLPSVYSRGEMEAVLSSGPYLPTVIIMDTQNIFELSFGIILNDGKESIDLTGITFETPDDEVEFF
ncbi:MAG: hypothetical protein OCC49_07985 [Fibrobacterales bacterium]